MALITSDFVNFKTLKYYTILILSLWTFFVIAVLSWIKYYSREATVEIARHHARSSFKKDLIYRHWSAKHGGAYVPITKDTPPNPYLSHIKERDITTPSGRRLTLINPAYMTRQAHELGFEQYGFRGHITSLNPIRPENAPDPWEQNALKSFDSAQTEVTSLEEFDGQTYLRFMKPLITEKNCLKCHETQGYKEGDIRGGISVAVPMEPIWAIERSNLIKVIFGYCILWTLGVIGIGIGYRNIKRRIEKHHFMQKKAVDLAKFPSEDPNPVLRITKDGILLYANPTSGSLLTEWSCQVGQIVPDSWRQIASEVFASGSVKRVQIEHTGRILSITVTPVAEADYVNLYTRDITKRQRAEDELKSLNEELEQRVAQLKASTKDLEAFAYSISHDLRTPLRSIDGFSYVLLEEHSENLNQEGKNCLNRIRANSQRMGQLIDDLLKLSHLKRGKINRDMVDLSAIAREMATELQQNQPDHRVEFVIAPDIVAQGDTPLLYAVMDNLLSNAWKFTAKCKHPRIEFGIEEAEGEKVYYIRDNGAGFDMAYVDKLFGAFQRLHNITEFPGTGIGLATVHRIIHRHGGRVWAKGAVEEGATFYFTLYDSEN